jgi:hypothetical protein
MPPVISILENGVMKMIRPIICPLAALILQPRFASNAVK